MYKIVECPKCGFPNCYKYPKEITPEIPAPFIECKSCGVEFAVDISEWLSEQLYKGIKFDNEKPMVDLIVPEFIEDLAKVLTIGAKKYAPNNWKKVGKERYLAATYRHLLAYHKGEKDDPESGLSHLIHCACNLMFMYWFDLQEKKDVKTES